MKNYSILRVISVIAISVVLTACNKRAHLCMGNVSSGDDGASNVVRSYVGPSLTQTRRNRIASIAESYVGSTKWATDVSKGNFPSGKPKCNKFVYDVLKRASVTAPLEPGRLWPLTTASWVNASHSISNWKYIGHGAAWERGDVVAERRNYTDATGHCGIAVSDSEVVAAGIYSVSKGSHDLFDGVVRRYEE